MGIKAISVSKSFGDFAALRDVSLEIAGGELLALLGPSGSGKTTLLRIIAGLDFPDAGEILIGGEGAASRRVQERKVGFVFQHYALFRHMTVFENIAFGLKVKPRKLRPGKEEIREKVHRLLRLVQLDWLADRYPAQLSGGQRQRIALARALAVEPRVLLLDEPFGALDAKVRRELRRWLRRLHDEIKVTSVFVTHDQEEALEVADRVVVMNEGRIEQTGTPEEVYDHPANPFVYRFIGGVNLFRGRVHAGEARVGGVRVELPENGLSQDSSVEAFVRPHDIEIHRTSGPDALVEAIIRHIRMAGGLVRLELDRGDGGEPVEAEMGRDQFLALNLKEGERVFLKPRLMRVFAEGSCLSVYK